MTQTKPSVLEGAEPRNEGALCEGTEARPPRPCRLLTPDGVTAPPEDESADPVGDGHSDADYAERHSERG